MKPVGIRSLAVAFPSVVRTNDYWKNKYPHIHGAWNEKTLARVFTNVDPSADSYAFDTEMAAFIDDPFRGTVERRALGPGESPLTLEQKAAEDALAAAGLAPADVGLMICGAFPPENVGLGDAAFLSARLGLTGASWNIESTCSTTLVALQSAAALVRAGEYENVLVVISCVYSRVMDEEDTLSWFLGDGAGAFVVGKLDEGQGVLGVKNINTSETCGAFFWDVIQGEGGTPRMVVKAGKNPGRALRDTSAPFVRKCCLGAAEAAGVKLADIDFFVFNTPLAWYHKFATRALDVDPAKTLTTYPLYANIGPALTTTNLWYAAHEGRIREGSLVMMFTVGTVSSAGAAVMRWGKVGLGPAP